MITIREAVPQKISGTSSIFLDFNYHPEIINIIKNCDSYSYDKKTHIWEVPITSLAYLLDNLTYIDSIRLQLMSNNDTSEDLTPIVKYKVDLFPHQREAIEYGLKKNHERFLLLDQPGLGKSCQAIHIAEELKAHGKIEHCLIICGVATLRANWEKEIAKHCDLSYVTIGKRVTRTGNIMWNKVSERANQLKKPLDAFFYIINIESIRNSEVIDALKTSENKIDMIVFDECHKCSPKSQQGNNLLKLKNYTYKIGMTGTLILNSPLSAFMPLKWIGVEHSTLTNFKAQYCEYGGYGGREIVGYKNLDVLKNEIDSCSLRRTKDLLSLPPKNLITEKITMDDKHRNFYEAVRDGVKEECNKIVLNKNNILSLMIRLRQATSCPSILTTEPILSSKMQRCVDLCEEIISQGDKVVVFSIFKQPVYELAELLKEYNPLLATGDIPDEQVSKNIDMFQEDNIHKVLLATHSKAGTGLTMNRARYMIMLDTPWTYAAFEQSCDRIHRVTNTEPVFIYTLVCENTCDEIVQSIVETKKAVSDFIVDDIQDEKTLDVLRSYILGL